jgi:DNA-binding LacI/PurR family transcriptional regulator
MQKITNTTRATTLSDVAAIAGVSHQTVSRVVNGHPSVSPKTLERVKQAISELNYQPNNAARDLASQHSKIIGAVSYRITHFGPAKLLTSFEKATKLRGYVLSNLTIQTQSPEEITHAIQSLRRQRVSGIILLAPMTAITQAELEHLCGDLPVIMADAEPRQGRYITAADAFTGARLAAQHLIGLGHQRIALLNGPLDRYSALLRNQGWQSVLQQAKIQAVASVESDWTASGGYQVTKGWLEAGLDFTALLAGNDQMALGAMRAIHQHGLLIPEEVSVIGYDDLPEAAYFEPPLTTIHEDFDARAQQSLDQLIARIENPADIRPLSLLIPELMVRESTAPPRSE